MNMYMYVPLVLVKPVEESSEKIESLLVGIILCITSSAYHTIEC